MLHAPAEHRASHDTSGRHSKPSGAERARRIVYDWLEAGEDAPAAARWVHGGLLLLIAVNVVMVVMETVEPVHSRFHRWFWAVEVASVAVFTVEYALRLWTATLLPGYAHPVWGRVRWALSPMALVDLLAILPFYLTMTHVDLRVLRVLRLARVFRVAKMARYARALRTLGRAVHSERENLLSALTILGLVLVVAASLMYYAEREAQPEAFSSIPAAMWWAIVTLTTVGYGDAYPVTVFGRIVGGVVAVTGIGSFAIPTAILGAAFLRELEARKPHHPEPGRCPHCGEELKQIGG
jgi:voltage-gated potassium channel